jgi:hypothetical protein
MPKPALTEDTASVELIDAVERAASAFRASKASTYLAPSQTHHAEGSSSPNAYAYCR